MGGIFKSFVKIMSLVVILIFMQNQVWAEERVYKEGDEGRAVAVIQQRLNKLGYTKMMITGVYDKKTTLAVKEFQKKNKLNPTGQTDEKTYQALLDAKTGAPGEKIDEIKVAKNYKDLNVKSGAILKTASQYLGVPYRYGGSSPDGFDCSGYVMYVFQKHQKNLPRTSDAQYKAGNKVDKTKLKEGDLVFFTTDEPGPSHVGIYYGNNKFIHASSSKGVMISQLSDVYWKPRYIGARRVL